MFHQYGIFYEILCSSSVITADAQRKIWVYERSVQIPSARYPALATIYCAVMSNIYGTSVWDLLHVTLLAPRNSEVAARLLENLCTSVMNKCIMIYPCHPARLLCLGCLTQNMKLLRSF